MSDDDTHAEADPREAAFERISNYIAMRDAQPLRGLSDTIHCINLGTIWEAELLLSDLRTVMEALT